MKFEVNAATGVSGKTFPSVLNKIPNPHPTKISP